MIDNTRHVPPPAAFPGEPGSLADVGRRRFLGADDRRRSLANELAYRERLHPTPSADEPAYRARLREELERA